MPEVPTPTAASADGAVQIVRSAEQVALHLPIAGAGSRILAYSVDYLVILVLQIAVVVMAMLSTPLLSKLLELLQPVLDDLRAGRAKPVPPSALVLIVVLAMLSQLVAEWAYFLACEALTDGRSIGKWAVGLRVVGDDGFPLTGRASLVRNLLRLVDLLPSNYVVGLIAMLVSARGQRLGDLAAGTLVVRLDRAAPAPPIDTDADPGSFRFSRAQLARLGATEKALLRQTLRRLDGLDPEPAAHALARTAEVLRARLDYPPVAAAEHERFLRALLRAVEA